jgi:hypothetical protein
MQLATLYPIKVLLIKTLGNLARIRKATGKRSTIMGDRGGKRNKEKSQKQSSAKHKQKENNKLKKQQKEMPLQGLMSDKTG